MARMTFGVHTSKTRESTVNIAVSGSLSRIQFAPSLSYHHRASCPHVDDETLREGGGGTMENSI
jgi:hypothetical protein